MKRIKRDLIIKLDNLMRMPPRGLKRLTRQRRNLKKKFQTSLKKMSNLKPRLVNFNKTLIKESRSWDSSQRLQMMVLQILQRKSRRLHIRENLWILLSNKLKKLNISEMNLIDLEQEHSLHLLIFTISLNSQMRLD